MGLSTLDQIKHLSADGLVELTEGQLHTLQRLLFGMADDIVACCEANGLAYNLGGGSVLGAVRHKGFIPWDDDLDMDMPRADFERFCEVFPRDYGDRYVLQIPGVTEGYPILQAKVRKRGTMLKSHSDTTDDCGITIDIFIRENTYDNPVLRAIHGIGCMYYGLMCSCVRFYYLKDRYLALSRGDPAFRRSVRVKSFIGFLGSCCSLRGWAAAADRWSSRCEDARSKYVVVPSGRKHFFGEVYERSIFGSGCPMPFEGRMWKVPARWDEYLTMHYGDYMKIPKDADKERHAYLAVDLGEDVGDATAGEAPQTHSSGSARRSTEATVL